MYLYIRLYVFAVRYNSNQQKPSATCMRHAGDELKGATKLSETGWCFIFLAYIASIQYDNIYIYVYIHIYIYIYNLVEAYTKGKRNATVSMDFAQLSSGHPFRNGFE